MKSVLNKTQSHHTHQESILKQTLFVVLFSRIEKFLCQRAIEIHLVNEGRLSNLMLLGSSCLINLGLCKKRGDGDDDKNKGPNGTIFRNIGEVRTRYLQTEYLFETQFLYQATRTERTPKKPEYL